MLEFKHNVDYSTDIGSISDCNIIIETIKEDFSVKIKLLNDIEPFISHSAIVASNTSSLSINSLSKDLLYRDRFIGLHFFNPVQKMKLVEVITSKFTNTQTINNAVGLVNHINYKSIMCKDTPGFIVNKLLIPQIVKAIDIYSQNLASIEDIDNAVKLGLGHPMGPLKLSDYIGNDVVLSIFKNITDTINNSSSGVELLEKMVRENQLGKKTGNGFYTWK